MPDYYNMPIMQQQATFMQACGQSTTVHNVSQAAMYHGLIHEEVSELDEARKAGDIVEVADALVDILVVTIGMGMSLGLPMGALWDEVMRSNMSKISEDGSVKKRLDGKVLKPVHYSPPNLRNVMIAHGWFKDESADG
jgi:predicted HAD superfamily Cof-like phosphohydrolase